MYAIMDVIWLKAKLIIKKTHLLTVDLTAVHMTKSGGHRCSFHIFHIGKAFRELRMTAIRRNLHMTDHTPRAEDLFNMFLRDIAR